MVGIDGEMIIPEHQRAEIVKGAARALGLYLILAALCWAALSQAKAIQGGSWPSGLWYLLLAAAYLLGSLLAKRSLASAWLYHLLSFVAVVPLLLMLLDAGARVAQVTLGDQWVYAFGAVALGLIGGIAMQASSTQKGQEELARRRSISPARNLSRTWDLSSPDLDAWGGSSNQAGGRRLWRLISPLLPAVGFALSRNMSQDFTQLFGTYLIFFFALTLSWMYARQLGLAMYVRRLNASLAAQAD
jgi:hypothetical protein